jgi:Mn2+/Fe2+ NRAMP family transporter
MEDHNGPDNGQQEPNTRRSFLGGAVATVAGGLVAGCASSQPAPGAAATAAGGTAGTMAAQLTPLLGRWATVVFAAGLFAAGMTSAITAPLAAAYAVAGMLGWPRDLTDRRLRLVWGAVIATGVLVALTGVQPVAAILTAQAANGLLLPIIAGFLVFVMNDRTVLGADVNRLGSNLAGALVVLVTLVLGGRAVFGVMQRLVAA